MSKDLQEWDRLLAGQLNALPAEERSKAEAVLPVIPSRDEWGIFCESVRQQWWTWEHCLTRYPACLIILYDGVAFFNMEEGEFWPHFAKTVGREHLPGSQQTTINAAYRASVMRFGLPMLEHPSSGDFNGSAFYHVGIPLGYWDGFLLLCQWAVMRVDWKQLPEESWREFLDSKMGGRKRLLRFAAENRVEASRLIDEMLGARSLLVEDPALKLNDVRGLVRIRPEYLEEVPETADFLRPSNPESLLDDRVRLCWDDSSRQISFHLPPVTAENAFWLHGTTRQAASSGADVMPLNGAAFAERLAIALEVPGQAAETQTVPGLKPFGLFDERKERFVNTRRSFLPLGSYRLVSGEPVSLDGSSGWDTDEEKTNQRYELEDGTQCFVSYLWPAASRAKLAVNGGHRIEFGRRQQINLRVFAGCDNTHVFRFAMRNGVELVVEQWPSLVLEIPDGFIEDSDAVRSREFQVLVNGEPAKGRWRYFHDYKKHGERWEYYEWRWDRLVAFGKHEIVVRSERVGILPFGTRQCQTVEIVPKTSDAIWPCLAGGDKYFSWVLLSAIQDEPTWEEFWIARHAIAGLKEVNLNQNDWDKLERHGYVRRKIMPLKTCLVFKRNEGGEFIAHFSGLVNRLYPLIRAVTPLKKIVSKQERGYPPHLDIVWPAGQRQYLRSLCPREGIQLLENSLWTH